MTGMALQLSHTTVNALDAHRQSVWWADLLGYQEDPDDPNEPGHEECMIFSPDGSHRILFIDVPDEKQGRNRVHFDLRPTDRPRDEEVERVTALGASVVQDCRTDDGRGWVVTADPEGNEFCILRSDDERRAAGDL
jgi:catechol 2,3-dioxygenase-like lactoylglutathione lyase family enzyme